MTQQILLVEPDFPYPTKSKNKAGQIHKNFVPIGLLKFGSLYKEKGFQVKLVRGNLLLDDLDFNPNEILITSLFTYWSEYFWNCVRHYRKLFPETKIIIGGIYVTLHYKKKKFKKLKCENDTISIPGINLEAEKYYPDYSLIPFVDYHATHMMRGCIRRCQFCGTWRLEPQRTFKNKDQIINELITIGKNKVIFYDNNILANPNIKEILTAFEDLRINNKPVIFESQSGFDGRLIEKDTTLPELLKKARFRNVRIAWDNRLTEKKHVEKQIEHLVNAGFTRKDISVFMIYNFENSYEDMVKKIKYCSKWGVQIADCRFRPLNSTYDHYNPRLKQDTKSYFINMDYKWTDKRIKLFRKKVREHNIWIRYGKSNGKKYDPKLEKWSAIHNTFKFFGIGRPKQIKLIEKDDKYLEMIKKLNRIKGYMLRNKIMRSEINITNKSQLIKEVNKIYKLYFNE